MTKEQRFLKSLKNRAEQLVRIIDLDSPPVLLANQVHLIRMAMIGLDAQALADVEMKWERERVLAGAGYCPTDGCPNEIEPPDTHLHRCQECLAQSAADDQQLQEELKLLPKEMFDGCDGSDCDGICGGDDNGTDGLHS